MGSVQEPLDCQDAHVTLIPLCYSSNFIKGEKPFLFGVALVCFSHLLTRLALKLDSKMKIKNWSFELELI